MSVETITTDIKVAFEHAVKMMRQGRVDLAQEQAEEILHRHPQEVNTLRLLAGIHREQEQYERAVSLLKQCLSKAPDYALAHQDLGYTFCATGDFDAAIESLRRATVINPDMPLSWRLLGELNSSLGHDEKAEQAFQQFLKYSITDETLARAARLMREGRLGKAENDCRNYLKKHPKDVNGIRLLAEIGIKVGMFDDAEQLLARCLDLAPDYHLARINYTQALIRRDKFSQALIQINQLKQREPNKPSHLLLKASVLIKMGQFDEAIVDYEYILSRFAPQAKIFLSYGHALKTVGRVQDAITAYHQAIALESSLGEAYWSLANLKTFRFSEHDIESMQASIQQGVMVAGASEADKISEQDYFHLCFALGKALEDKSQFSQSFKYYQLGNQSKQRQEHYHADDTTRLVTELIDVCQPKCFPQDSVADRQAGCLAADPIFIVGLPRSGSTLLEQILASHSLVEGTKELHDIIAISRKLGQRRKKSDPSFYPGIISQLSDAQCLELGEEYLARTRVHRQTSSPYFIDKMPNNWLHVGLIRKILPNAKIIDARRQPMSACFSGYKQLFASGQSFSYDLNDLGRYYADYIKLMNWWNDLMPGHVLCMQYEEMVIDTEQQVRRLLDYCGLSFETSCVNFHENKRDVKTPSSEQVRQPIYASAVDQWRQFEPYLGELDQTLKSFNV